MSQFRKKAVTVEAVQWFKTGDHAAVEDRRAHILFSRDRQYFYVSHFDEGPGVTRPTAWVAVELDGERAKTQGVVLPFSTWDVKSGDEGEMKAHPELVNRYMEVEGWSRWPEDRGYVPGKPYGELVAPGDWIVTDGGATRCFSPAVFAATFEAIDQV